MQANNVIIILCLFLAHSYAQQQAPEPEWISGLPEDIAHMILLTTVKIANSDKECFQTLHNLSCVNKQWHKLVQPEENKVCAALAEKHIQVHKRLGLALSEKFLLNPVLAVALGIHVVKEQAKKFEQLFEEDSKKTYYGSYAASRWHHRCLGHAIRKSKKEIVKLLCPMKYMNISNLTMNSDWEEIPLLAGAIIYNDDEDALTIMDCLWNAGAFCSSFKLIAKEAASEANTTEERIKRAKIKYADREEYDLPKLAQMVNKPKIVAKLNERNKKHVLIKLKDLQRNSKNF